MKRIVTLVALVSAVSLHAQTEKYDNNASETGNASIANYIYMIPPGWTEKQYSDGIVLSAPVSNNGEKCSMTILPMRAYGGNLQNDATQLLFGTYTGFQVENSDYATLPSMIRGISPQGWEYFIVKTTIKPTGNYSKIFAFAFVAKLGNTLAAIVGSSKDPLVSACFGELQANVWPNFFYNLQFKNWNSQGNGKDMMRRMAGIWMGVTATAGDRIVFAINGRYAGASASQQYYSMSGGSLLTVTDAYFGDGSYSLAGNRIMLTHDNDKNRIDNGFIRLEQESKDDGRTWKEKLYLLRTSAVDGKEYEISYNRQQN